MGTLFINGTEVAATGFAYDGCHKIWLIFTDSDREALIDAGYTTAEFRPVSELPAVWEATCPLRFILSAANFDSYIEQGADGTVEYGDIPTAIIVDDEAMSEGEWLILSDAANILERYGYHDESVAVFRIAERGE